MLNKIKKTIYIMLLFIPLFFTSCGISDTGVTASKWKIEHPWFLSYEKADQNYARFFNFNEINLNLEFAIEPSIVPDYYNPSNKEEIIKSLSYGGTTYRFHSLCFYAFNELSFEMRTGSEVLTNYYRCEVTIDELNAYYDDEKINFFTYKPVNDYQKIENVYLFKEFSKDELLSTNHHYIEKTTEGCLGETEKRYESNVNFPKELFTVPDSNPDIRKIIICIAYCFYSEEKNNYLLSFSIKTNGKVDDISLQAKNKNLDYIFYDDIDKTTRHKYYVEELSPSFYSFHDTILSVRGQRMSYLLKDEGVIIYSLA